VEVDESFGAGLYSADEQSELPAEALAASLGCDNPLGVAELRPGERVLDLGSGGGIDVLLSARRVGETGFAYGVDMTEEMLALARANAQKAGARNVEFVKGTIEDVPLPDGAVDVVISNCVINLSVDKPAVLAEMFRVLRPGGRIGVSDVVAEDHLSTADRADRGSYVGCIAGALSKQEYLDGLAASGVRRRRGNVHSRGRAGHVLGDRARGQAGRSGVVRRLLRPRARPARATTCFCDACATVTDCDTSPPHRRDPRRHAHPLAPAPVARRRASVSRCGRGRRARHAGLARGVRSRRG
jgi:SAM-dependent methyltransferase